MNQSDWVSQTPPSGEAVQGHSFDATIGSRGKSAALAAARCADPRRSGVRVQRLGECCPRLEGDSRQGSQDGRQRAQQHAGASVGDQQHGAV